MWPWISGYPCNSVLNEECVNVGSEPGRVPGFTHKLSVEGTPEHLKERFHCGTIELQAWGKLDEDWPQFRAQSRDFTQEPLQRLCDIAKATFMSDRLRHLHGKPEVIGDVIRPALVGR